MLNPDLTPVPNHLAHGSWADDSISDLDLFLYSALTYSFRD
jgi:hypothetical protein